MNTFKNKPILLTLLSLFILINGCDLFEVEDRSFRGSTVGFARQAQTIQLTPSQGGTIEVGVQLIAEQRSEPITFDVVTIDSLTSAREGVDYSLPTSSVTIPADSSEVPFQIQVSGSQLEEDETRTLTLQVLGTEDVETANVIGRFELNLVGIR